MMNEVTINRINPPMVRLYRITEKEDKMDREYCGNKLKYIGWLNEYELNDVRVQIKEMSLTGYMIRFEDENDVEHMIQIDSRGELEYYPNGLLDIMSNYYLKLI